MKRNPVGWFEIYVNDSARAKKFYEGVLQLKLEPLGDPNEAMEMWAFPDEPGGGGASGALCRMKGFEAGKNSVLIYFTSADCAAEEKRVTEFGGKIQKPKRSIGQYGFITLAFDTEGNLFGIHSMR